MLQQEQARLAAASRSNEHAQLGCGRPLHTTQVPCAGMLRLVQDSSKMAGHPMDTPLFESCQGSNIQGRTFLASSVSHTGPHSWAALLKASQVVTARLSFLPQGSRLVAAQAKALVHSAREQCHVHTDQAHHALLAMPLKLVSHHTTRASTTPALPCSQWSFQGARVRTIPPGPVACLPTHARTSCNLSL